MQLFLGSWNWHLSKKNSKQSCIILKGRGVASSKVRNSLSLIGCREDILGQNSSVHDNITTTPGIQTSKAAKLQIPFTAQSSVWSILCGARALTLKGASVKNLSFAQKNLQIGITSSLEAELMPRHGAQSKQLMLLKFGSWKTVLWYLPNSTIQFYSSFLFILEQIWKE